MHKDEAMLRHNAVKTRYYPCRPELAKPLHRAAGLPVLVPKTNNLAKPAELKTGFRTTMRWAKTKGFWGKKTRPTVLPKRRHRKASAHDTYVANLLRELRWNAKKGK